MKKIVLALAATTLFSSAFAQTFENSSSGEITFSGEVTTAACSMTSENVPLYSYTVRDLAGATATGEWGQGSIRFINCDLGTGDDAISSVDVSFAKSTGVGTNNRFWSNQGTATNVGVEIQVAGAPLLPATADAPINVALQATGSTLLVQGRTVKLSADDATPGTVKQALRFNAVYK